MADYTQNLTPEQLSALNSFFSQQGATRQTQFGGGDAGPTYNTETNFADVGGTKYQLGGAGNFATEIGQNRYAGYDPSGKFTGEYSVTPDKMTQMMPYIVGAGLGGIAAFGGAGAGGLTELGSGALAPGETAMTGLMEPGAAAAAGGSAAGGGVMSQLGTVGKGLGALSSFISPSNSDLTGKLLGGLVTSALTGGKNSDATSAASAADPFSTQRAGYQAQLQKLMTDPSAFKQTAGQQAITQQGMDTATAKLSTMGLQGSGAQAAALTNIATTNAAQNYQQEIANLMQLSGVNAGSPASAGQILQNQNQANTQAAGTFGNYLGGLAAKGLTGLSGLMSPTTAAPTVDNFTQGVSGPNTWDMSGENVGSGLSELGIW